MYFVVKLLQCWQVGMHKVSSMYQTCNRHLFFFIMFFFSVFFQHYIAFMSVFVTFSLLSYDFTNEFVGLKITPTWFLSTDTIFNTIQNFPQPTDMTRPDHGYVRPWAYLISPILQLFWNLVKVNSKFRWRHTHTHFWKLKIILISEVKEDIQSLDFSWKHVANWQFQRRHSLSPSTTILWFCNFTSSHLLPRWMETQIHRVKVQ